jgi:hypothetical protein
MVWDCTLLSYAWVRVGFVRPRPCWLPFAGGWESVTGIGLSPPSPIPQPGAPGYLSVWQLEWL